MAGGIDYRDVGLIVGLEIHQQLQTSRKLFCPCPAELSEEEHDEFERRLRPTRGEAGEVDVAALFEWRKGRSYRYEAPVRHSCLVEADEEPPHEISREAVVIAMAVAKAFNSHIVDEIHVMRKIVIDGSNTTGFQRTAIVALGGSLNVHGKEIPIETIAVEEDAARKLREERRRVWYRLDRLGIPLIEISTGPVIHDPQEAAEVALAIGRTLRLTGRVRRGLGTIRQDLNVSIRGGAKTEIKGVQRLDLIPKVIEYEVRRQLGLLEVKRELEARGARKEDYDHEPVDVSEVFQGTKSKIIRRALQAGGRVLAVRLPHFHGLLGKELMPGRRVGTEFADYVRFWADVKGIFHSDELPGYGITGEELDKVYTATGAVKGRDAVVIVAEDESKARKAIEAILMRAKMALDGVPEETRGALEDGTTRFLRPRPGSARMYPETDIPPRPVTEEMHGEAEELKPEPVEVKYEKLTKRYGLSKELANEVLRDVRLDLIERLLEKYSDRVKPTTLAGFFVVTLRGLKGEGVDVDAIPDERLEEMVRLLAEGRIAKEALEELAKAAAENPGKSVEELVEELGLGTLTPEEARRIIQEIIQENIEAVKTRGMKAMGLIMGRAMAKLRGRIDGRIVAQIVREELEKTLQG